MKSHLPDTKEKIQRHFSHQDEKGLRFNNNKD